MRVRALFAFLPAVVGLTAGSPLLRADEAGDDVAKGNVAFQAGRIDEAIADYSAALRLNPADGLTYATRGIAYVKLKDYDRAIADFTAFIQGNPDFVDGYNYRGAAYEEKGRHDQAIADYDHATRIDPDNAQAYALRAIAYEDKGEHRKALADCARALQHDAGYLPFFYARGDVARNKRDYERALANYNAAIEVRPKSPRAYFSRGQTYGAIGRFDLALADYRESIRLKPDLAMGYNNVAWILATCPQDAFRNGPEAVKAARKACDLTQWNNAVCIDTLAAACAEAGDFPNAVKWESRYLEFPLPKKSSDGGGARLDLYRHGHAYRANPGVN
jgi:tetratricopeptide (TPR) repeat protein